MLRIFWLDYIMPILRRPLRYQVAALRYRREHGRLDCEAGSQRPARGSHGATACP